MIPEMPTAASFKKALKPLRLAEIGYIGAKGLVWLDWNNQQPTYAIHPGMTIAYRVIVYLPDERGSLGRLAYRWPEIASMLRF